MRGLCASIALVLLWSVSISAQIKGAPGPVTAQRQIDGRLRVNGSLVGSAGILIILNDLGGAEVTRTMSDSSGRFYFPNLQPQNYQIVIQQRQFQYFSRDVDLTFSPAASVNINLVPVPSHDTDAPPPGTTISAKLPGNDTARREFEKGQEVLASGRDIGSSISHLQKAMKAEPTFEPTYVLLGKAYMDQKKWKEAEEVLRKGAQLDTKDFAAEFMLGACLNQERDFAGAEKALLRSLEINPQAVEGHYELARTYLATNDWQKAEPHVTQAIKLNPQFAPAHVAMGNIYLKKGDAPSAQAQYQEYLKLDPEGMFAPGVKSLLEKMKAVSNRAKQ